ncbi:MAG: type II secretion system F family protein, partial [Planctomycetota bacterium]
MPEYRYLAKNLAGDNVRGVVAAESEAAAVRSLDESRLFPIEVALESAREESLRRAGVKSRDLGQVYSQLADLLASGVPLLRSLQSLQKASVNRRVTLLLQDIHDSVADGKSLTESMRDHPKVFPSLHTAMVQAGERASFLEDVLTSLASFIERLDELQGKVRGALIYPALLTTLGTCVMLAALVFFVPKFEPLLEGVEKPLPTVVVFGMSHAVR